LQKATVVEWNAQRCPEKTEDPGDLRLWKDFNHYDGRSTSVDLNRKSFGTRGTGATRLPTRFIVRDDAERIVINVASLYREFSGGKMTSNITELFGMMAQIDKNRRH